MEMNAKLLERICDIIKQSATTGQLEKLQDAINSRYPLIASEILDKTRKNTTGVKQWT
jgi:hypothetical protein